MRKPGRARVLAAIHEQTALAGLVAIAVHGITLLGDAFLRPGIAGITIPGAIGYRPLWTGLGIAGGYLAAALGLSLLHPQVDRPEALAPRAPADDRRLPARRRPHARRGHGREHPVAAGVADRHRPGDRGPVRDPSDERLAQATRGRRPRHREAEGVTARRDRRRPRVSSGVVIAGGGLAAQRCAETLRSRGYEGRIRIVCAEPTPPYDRPPLSKEPPRSDEHARALGLPRRGLVRGQRRRAAARRGRGAVASRRPRARPRGRHDPRLRRAADRDRRGAAAPPGPRPLRERVPASHDLAIRVGLASCSTRAPSWSWSAPASSGSRSRRRLAPTVRRSPSWSRSSCRSSRSSVPTSGRRLAALQAGHGVTPAPRRPRRGDPRQRDGREPRAQHGRANRLRRGDRRRGRRAGRGLARGQWSRDRRRAHRRERAHQAPARLRRRRRRAPVRPVASAPTRAPSTGTRRVVRGWRRRGRCSAIPPPRPSCPASGATSTACASSTSATPPARTRWSFGDSGEGDGRFWALYRRDDRAVAALAAGMPRELARLRRRIELETYQRQRPEEVDDDVPADNR